MIVNPLNAESATSLCTFSKDFAIDNINLSM